MKNTYKVITISDIVEWDSKNEIKLNPKYQRNTVWNEKTKSYLMDTIVRGLPIPPIFLRQSIDVAAKVTYREVVDGQQRTRAILDFINNKYSISKSHNQEVGNILYDDLPDEIKEDILEYQIFAVIVTEKDDNVVYDMFARLNTNNYVLNRQEIRNSKYWGEFKIASYNYAAKYRSFFVDNRIFSDRSLSRMDDVEFISTLMNVTINGITTDTPKSLDKLYEDNNKCFARYNEVEEKLTTIMKVLIEIYPDLNSNNYFTSKVSVYTLFCALCQLKYGNLLNSNLLTDIELKDLDNNKLINKINDFNNDAHECIHLKSSDNDKFFGFIEFDKYHRTRTTNKEERIKRVLFLTTYLCED